MDHQLIKEALYIRKVEEKLFDLFALGKIPGTIHTCIGQEFSGIAFAQHLTKNDAVFSNHRCHGHYLSFTKNYQGLIAELIGKETGICAGIGSSQHLCDSNFYSNGVQGGMVSVSAGMALAQKLRGKPNIAVVFIGDGTLGEGSVYETMNIASLWNIPLLIVCENNQYAQSTHCSINLAGDILKRPEAFGLTTYRSNIWEMEKFLANAKTSIDFVRKNSRPAFHLIDTYRLYPHSKGDDTRSQQELDKYRNLDPVNVFSKTHAEVFHQFHEEIDKEINKIVEDSLGAATLSLDQYYQPKAMPQTGAGFEEIKEIDSRQVELINDFFDKAMEEDKNILFIGEDVLSPYGGAFKVAKGLSDKYPGRVFSTPISEDAIAGISNGLALAGFRPFLEIMFGDFLMMCMNQIVNHASKFHHMYNKQVHCPIVIRTPMGGRRGYGSTHSQTLDKFVVGIDNVTTIALNTLIDPRTIYQNIWHKQKHPVIVIENKTDYTKKIAKKRIKNYKYEKSLTDYPIARISPVAGRPNATIVTYGGMVDMVLDAVEPLFTELEIIPQIIVLSRIHPIDYSDIVSSVEVTKKLFVVEEGSFFAGIGSEIIASVTQLVKDKIITKRISSLPVPIPAAKSLEEMVLPNSLTIVNAIQETLL